MTTAQKIKYYAKKSGPYAKRDVQTIGEELAKLAEKGKLTPKVIVQTATPEDSILHPFFEWNDAVAANRYRETQAGEMTRSVRIRVEVNDEEQEVRAFHSVKLVTDDASEASRSYSPVHVIQDDEDAMEQVISNAYQECATWYQNYLVYRKIFPGFDQQYAPVFDAIEQLEEPVPV